MALYRQPKRSRALPLAGASPNPRNPDPAKELVTARGAAVEIASNISRLPVAWDGEVVSMRPPLLYRSRPGDLLVIVPPPTSQ